MSSRRGWRRLRVFGAGAQNGSSAGLDCIIHIGLWRFWIGIHGALRVYSRHRRWRFYIRQLYSIRWPCRFVWRLECSWERW